jgi:hypothetical protein
VVRHGPHDARILRLVLRGLAAPLLLICRCGLCRHARLLRRGHLGGGVLFRLTIRFGTSGFKVCVEVCRASSAESRPHLCGLLRGNGLLRRRAAHHLRVGRRWRWHVLALGGQAARGHLSKDPRVRAPKEQRDGRRAEPAWPHGRAVVCEAAPGCGRRDVQARAPRPAGETDVSAGKVAREPDTRRGFGGGRRRCGRSTRRCQLGVASAQWARGGEAHARHVVVDRGRVVLLHAAGGRGPRGWERALTARRSGRGRGGCR